MAEILEEQSEENVEKIHTLEIQIQKLENENTELKQKHNQVCGGCILCGLCIFSFFVCVLQSEIL